MIYTEIFLIQMTLLVIIAGNHTLTAHSECFDLINATGVFFGASSADDQLGLLYFQNAFYDITVFRIQGRIDYIANDYTEKLKKYIEEQLPSSSDKNAKETLELIQDQFRHGIEEILIAKDKQEKVTFGYFWSLVSAANNEKLLPLFYTPEAWCTYKVFELRNSHIISQETDWGLQVEICKGCIIPVLIPHEVSLNHEEILSILYGLWSSQEIMDLIGFMSNLSHSNNQLSLALSHAIKDIDAFIKFILELPTTKDNDPKFLITTYTKGYFEHVGDYVIRDGHTAKNFQTISQYCMTAGSRLF